MADYTVTYGTATAITIGLGTTPLASSSNKTGGRSSAVIDNTSNKYVDALVSGYIKVSGTAPTTGKSIDIWAWAKHTDDTYPDAITGSDADITLTSVDIRNAGLRLGGSTIIDATASRVYHFAPFSVASLFGGIMPLKWGLWVTQDTGQALNASGHALYYVGVSYSSA